MTRASRFPARVAFSLAKPYHQRIAFGSGTTKGSVTPLDGVFDTTELRLNTNDRPAESEVLPRNWQRKDWDVESVKNEFFLTQGGARRARLPLQPVLEGTITATCWIPGREQSPHAVAVGTSGSGNVYVFRVAQQGDASLIRQFRGHEGPITSIAVARDLRYLATASRDATIRVWPLSGAFTDDALANRWGATFEIRDDRLVVTAIRNDGPLYFRGVRAQDTITAVGYQKDDETITLKSPQEMLTELDSHTWEQMLLFEYRRDRGMLRAFQMFSRLAAAEFAVHR